MTAGQCVALRYIDQLSGGLGTGAADQRLQHPGVERPHAKRGVEDVRRRPAEAPPDQIGEERPGDGEAHLPVSQRGCPAHRGGDRRIGLRDRPEGGDHGKVEVGRPTGGATAITIAAASQQRPPIMVRRRMIGSAGKLVISADHAPSSSANNASASRGSGAPHAALAPGDAAHSRQPCACAHNRRRSDRPFSCA